MKDFFKRFSRLNASPLARGVLQLASGTAAAQLISFAVYPLLTRIYADADFGAYAVYMSAVGIVGTVSTLRYDMAVPLPRSHQEGLDVVALALSLNLVTALVFGLVSLFFPSVLAWISGGAAPTYLIWLVPAGVVTTGTYKVLRMWAVRHSAYRVISTTGVAQTLGATVFQLGFALARFPGPGLVVGNLLGSALGIASIASRTLRGRGLSFQGRASLWHAAKRHWSFAVMGAPAALLNSLSTSMPALLIASFYSLGAAGQFGLAMRVIGVPLSLIGGSIESVFYGEASIIGKEDPRRIRALVNKLTTRMALAGALPVIVLVAFAPSLFSLVFGLEWWQAGVFTRYLTVFMFLNLLSVPFSSVYLIFDRLHLNLILNTVKACVAIGALYFPYALGYEVESAMLVYALCMGAFYLMFGLGARTVLKNEIRRVEPQDS